MAFAEAQGNESIAKANYLRYRAGELQQEHNTKIAEEARKSEEQAREAAFARLLLCPDCGDIVPLSSPACPNCSAIFGPLSTRAVASFNESEQLDKLRRRYINGDKLTANQITFLVAASAGDKSLALLKDRWSDETLLHWCARLGLAHKAAVLIANGADINACNSGGLRPFELCTDSQLRSIL